MLKIDVEGKTVCNGVDFDTVEISDILDKQIGAAWTSIPSYMSGDFFSATPDDSTARATFLFGFRVNDSTPITVLTCEAYVVLLRTIMQSKVYIERKQAMLNPSAGVVEDEFNRRIDAAFVSQRKADSMLRYVGRLNAKAARGIPLTDEEKDYYVPKLDDIDEWEDQMLIRKRDHIAAGRTQVSDDALWPAPPAWLPEFVNKF